MNTVKEQQRLLLRTIIDLSRENGFHYFSIDLLAEKTGVPALDIYDANRETGYLWPFDPRAQGPLAGGLLFNKGAVALGEDYQIVNFGLGIYDVDY